MKKSMRSNTNAQQAPTRGRSGVARQASRSLPVQTASMIRKLSSGGTIHPTSSRIDSSVSTMLSGPENRFSRTQPIDARDRASGGGIAGDRLRVRT